MACIIYRHLETSQDEQTHQACIQYAKNHNLDNPKIIEDDHSIKNHWSERKIGQVITSMKANDHFICYEAPELVCSTSQILELLSIASDHGIQIHFVKYNLKLENINNTANTQMLLTLIAQIESDFISSRTSKALAKRKAAGLPLGRPKGKGNKTLKLDRYKDEIVKYMTLGISKASIAKLVDCHPQTLYDWLDRQSDISNKMKTSVMSD